jgi:hypothetical protein
MRDTLLTRRNLAILIVALILAIGFLIFRPQDASAQLIGDDGMNPLTLERLLILGMLGLVVLTWFYLKWRPAPDFEDEPEAPPERD